MKLLLVSVVLLPYVLTNNKNDGAGPSNFKYDEETCITNENVEVLLDLIFGLNLNYSSNWVEAFPEVLRQLNVMHIIYNDQFRIIFQGYVVNDTTQPDLKSRFEYFFQRVLLRAEEMIFEASRPDGAQRREIQYEVSTDRCSIDFTFNCRLSLYQPREPVENSQRRCTTTVKHYQKNGCAIDTFKLAENLDQNVPCNSSRSLLLQDVVMPCVLMTRFGENTGNEGLEVLRANLRIFFWLINPRNRNCHAMHSTIINTGFNMDLERMITDDQYLIDLMRSSRLGFERYVSDDDSGSEDSMSSSSSSFGMNHFSDSDSEDSSSLGLERFHVSDLNSDSQGSMSSLSSGFGSNYVSGLVSDCENSMRSSSSGFGSNDVSDLHSDSSSSSDFRRSHDSDLTSDSEDSMNSLGSGYKRFYVPEPEELMPDRCNDCQSHHWNAFEQMLLPEFQNLSNAWRCMRTVEKISVMNSEKESSTTTQGPDGPGRSKRYATFTRNSGKNKVLKMVIRQRLMDFAFISLKDQTEANYLNKSLEWSKDFNQLYDQFLRKNWTNVLCQDSYSGFDNFLYSRLHQLPDWSVCTLFKSSIKDEWCLAIRHIILNTDSKGNNPWLSKSLRSKQFLKDRIVVYKMLNEVSSADSVPTQDIMNKKMIQAAEISLKNGVINLASIFLSFARINPCFGKEYAGAKRDVKESDKPRWFLDPQFRAQCF